MKRTVFLRAAALMLGLAFCLVSGCNVLAPKQSNIKAENCNGSGIDIDIKPVEFLKLGDHVYYPSEGFFVEEEIYRGQNDAIRSCLEEKDKGETANVFVFSYSIDGGSDKIQRVQVYGREYDNGIILEDRPYCCQSGDSIDHFTRTFGHKRVHHPNKSSAISVDKFMAELSELLIKNTADMRMDKGNTVYGTYLLKYIDGNDLLYYEFTINTSSTVKVNARTGEIIEYNFDDGIPDYFDD